MPDRRPWTDEELGFLQDNWDRPLREQAEHLGRSRGAVSVKRADLRRGWTPKLNFWTPEEDEVIIRGGSYAGLRQLADQLPGRSEEAISIRRSYLGIKVAHWQEQLPGTIAARPLIAKTCTVCGRLLQAEWFSFSTSRRSWNSACRLCHSDRSMATPSAQAKQTTDKYHRWQRLTEEQATRTGERYTEADHKVLSDPDLTILQKAFRIKRSFAATMSICTRSGYKSHYAIGEPTDLWRIFNPNEPAA